jgi:hypothetical protein
VTAASLKNLIIAVAAFVVAAPALAIVFDLGPMGYHTGTALLVRVVAVFLATVSLATVFAVAGYLYWLHVVAPAPRPSRVREPRGLLVLKD